MSPDSIQLAARMLGLTVAQWEAVLARYEAAARDGSAKQRLATLAEAFAPCRPQGSLDVRGTECPACGGDCAPFICAVEGMTYGQCRACGHGRLLTGAAAQQVYGDAAYFQRREANGVGYADAASERAYRETKGQKLIDRLKSAHGGAPATLLEVGSGLGFTRAAAERLGLRTTGVDVNPAAAEGARAAYGFDTFVGSLGELLTDGHETFDLVLYQFVLEHIGDLASELACAARALAPSGLACFVVPSMEAAEIDVFGGAYRSFRADHLHLFTARSLYRLLAAAGLVAVSIESSCNVHLLSPALSRDELDLLYAAGSGPDLMVIARRNER